MKQGSLFENQLKDPLASRLRPQTLEEYIGQKHLVGQNKVSFHALGSLDDYLRVDAIGDDHLLIKAVSQLFEKGYIHVLIGTKSLLGEGWDCPSVNTLILASFVGSFMLSNQMRGRAIRIDRNNPHKCSHIWHLVCLKPKINHWQD